MVNTRYIFVDTETTGLSPFSGGHRVIELSCVEYIGKNRTGKVFHHLLNPEGKSSTEGSIQATTPASRLGLVDNVYNAKDILGFNLFKKLLEN